MKLNHLYHGDCLEIMKFFPENSIDMILCDLPYGVTACKWDSIIDIDLLFNEYRRIIKVQGCIVLTSNIKFSSLLIEKTRDIFKYSWFWKKFKPTGFQHVKNKPMEIVELILIFSKGSMGHKNLLKDKRMIYNPQGNIKSVGISTISKNKHGRILGERPNQVNKKYVAYTGYPNNLLEFKGVTGVKALHPTQKPVKLFEYLIKTYTNENDIVLDNCIGSGTTAIAALNTNRKWIGIEKDDEYYRLALDRIENHKKELGIEENKKIKFRIPV